jgi:LCP family protein required for cell wall assembly
LDDGPLDFPAVAQVELSNDESLPDPESTDERRPGWWKQRPWWAKTLIIVGAVVLAGTGGTVGLFFAATDRYDNKVEREDILEGVPSPEEDLGTGMNFLVLGSDSRSDADTQSLDETGSRSDTIMLVHIQADQTAAFIVSIPRDSYVNVPPGGGWAGGPNKINAALAFGGANLAAKAVYELTQIPLNGAMIVNFGGVHKMVEAVGGVNVCTPFEVRSSFSSRVWTVGCHDMTPAEVEEFMRQRYNVPGGDFGRIKNQQNVIKGLLQKVTSSDVLTNPIKLDAMLSTAAESLTVDQDLNLRSLVLSLRGIKAENVTYATVPVAGLMTTEAGSSVQLDAAGADELWAAIREDRTDEWLATHPQPEVASFQKSASPQVTGRNRKRPPTRVISRAAR